MVDGVKEDERKDGAWIGRWKEGRKKTEQEWTGAPKLVIVVLDPGPCKW
jgi:hypothetical protein